MKREVVPGHGTELAKSNPEITDGDVLLYRQVPISWVEDGMPSSQAFYPQRKDGGRLSIDDGRKTTAQASFDAYNARGNTSGGTWALSVAEANAAPRRVILAPPLPGNAAMTLPVALVVREDPILGNEAHAFIDFVGVSKRACEVIGAVLLISASERGRLYPV